MVRIYTTIQGFKAIDIDNYYPSRSTEKVSYFKFDKVMRITETLKGSEFGITIITPPENSNFNLCFQSDFTNFETVESVEGITPTSHDHLVELLLNFFQ